RDSRTVPRSLNTPTPQHLNTSTPQHLNTVFRLMFIDTHCHLYHADYDADRGAVVARAVAAGVGAMVVIGYDLESSEAAVRLAGADARLFAAVGVHPHDAGTLDAAALSRLRALAGNAR